MLMDASKLHCCISNHPRDNLSGISGDRGEDAQARRVLTPLPQPHVCLFFLLLDMESGRQAYNPVGLEPKLNAEKQFFRAKIFPKLSSVYCSAMRYLFYYSTCFIPF